MSPPILCAVFTVRGSERTPADDTSEDEWFTLPNRFESATNSPISRDLFVEGVVRGVTESQIVIAKRDERRLWTATAAREDVEATMLRVMAIQQSNASPPPRLTDVPLWRRFEVMCFWVFSPVY